MADFSEDQGHVRSLGPVILGSNRRVFNLGYTWWGRSQWHKWRWHGDHIDLGPLSIYNLPVKGPWSWFWRTVAMMVKPFRWWYHRRFVYSIRAQVRNAEWEMNQ